MPDRRATTPDEPESTLLRLSPALKQWFREWSERRGVTGYNDRYTWESTLQAVREVLISYGED